MAPPLSANRSTNLSKKGRSKKKHLHQARAAARFAALPEAVQSAMVRELRAEYLQKMSAEIALHAPARGIRRAGAARP